jgi:uncharacterized protein YbbK (DUF523 family)
MSKFARPIIVISKCIEFDACRWDGQMISNDFVKSLKKHVDFIPVCPEVEIGLGIPRRPIRIIKLDGELRLVQPATGLDITERMLIFTKSFLSSLNRVDGFILESRSPTSAFSGAKIYDTIKTRVSPIGKGPGFFGKEVINTFGGLAITDYGRLRNRRLKEHFLTKLFTLASLRQTEELNSLTVLLKFHSENRILIGANNKQELSILDQIVANEANEDWHSVIKE